jgi:hypothetical protein
MGLVFFAFFPLSLFLWSIAPFEQFPLLSKNCSIGLEAKQSFPCRESYSLLCIFNLT